jgi:hypothetical protein
MSPRITACFDGPLDIVGDVHGEIDALRQLLGHLGYDGAGRHPAGRRLVFVGDLCDRGPDSPAVVDWVRRAVERGLAQCLLGNHELLLLIGESRESLRWYLDPSHPELQPGGKYAHSRVVPQASKPVFREFFESLPLVLERPDLRLVHAAWLPASIQALREEPDAGALALYQAAEARIESGLQRDGTAARETTERAAHAAQLLGADGNPPLLPALAEANLRRNLDNPVRVLTFGPDRLATRPYYVMERWRMAERDRWWDHYTDDTPVVIGHYWRKLQPSAAVPQVGPKMPPVFDADLAPGTWLGPKHNVFCVDYSVGARFAERQRGVAEFETHLGALRWPECRLVLETGQVIDADRRIKS